MCANRTVTETKLPCLENIIHRIRKIHTIEKGRPSRFVTTLYFTLCEWSVRDILIQTTRRKEKDIHKLADKWLRVIDNNGDYFGDD